MKCFNDDKFEPSLIVDLESKRFEIEEYIKEKGLSSQFYFIKSENRDKEELTEEDNAALLNEIRRLGITHCIISTEPKAHKAYITFCLKNNIHVLVDKPLTAPTDVINDCEQAKKIKQDYYDIIKLYEQANEVKPTALQVQCQRRWHNGYRFAHKIARETIEKYNIPITSIHVSHCDGMWNMPDEFITRENHPYKYGYGKLFHSGYHFVDLVAWFSSLNNLLEDKKADTVELYASAVKADDFMSIIQKKDYHNLLNTDKFDTVFDNYDSYGFNKFGEVDINSILTFKRGDKSILVANMNLIQNGFSRRSWSELPEDTYKANGRVRHEYMNIEIGPLMNIQIHSYQSKEISDRVEGAYAIGEVEHFNMYVFRNVDLIGGKAMERYTLQELYNDEEIMLGFNETARKKAFDEFIECSFDPKAIYEHELGITILSKEYEALSKIVSGKPAVIEFNL